MQQPRTVIISGANRGIGLEIVKSLVSRGIFVFLGSRNFKRGEIAKEGLVAENPAARDLVQVLELDVLELDMEELEALELKMFEIEMLKLGM